MLKTKDTILQVVSKKKRLSRRNRTFFTKFQAISKQKAVELETEVKFSLVTVFSFFTNQKIVLEAKDVL